jgi:hypothetical protein
VEDIEKHQCAMLQRAPLLVAASRPAWGVMD